MAAVPLLALLAAAVLPAGRIDTARLSVRFDESDRVPATALSRMVDAVVDDLCEDLAGCGPEVLTPPLRVVAARDLAGLRAALGPGVPEWAAGIAYPHEGVAGVRMDPRAGGWGEVERTLRHELSHLLLHRAVGGRPVPAWFREGFAMIQARQWSFDRARSLTAAALTGRLLSLHDLEEGFPSGRGEVTLAYAQAAAVVGSLLRDDPVAFVALLRAVRAGQPFRDALQRAYGAPVAALEERWRADLSTDYALVPLVTGGGTVWTVATALFLLAYLRRRRAARATLLRWENEDDDAL